MNVTILQFALHISKLKTITMSGAGSVLAMIKTLKDNRRLKRSSRDRYQNKRKELYKIKDKDKLKFKEVSKEELERIKIKNLEIIKKQERKVIFSFLFFTIIMLGLLVSFLK